MVPILPPERSRPTRPRWRQRLALATAEPTLLATAMLVVTSVRIALWLLPPRWVAQGAVRLQRRQGAVPRRKRVAAGRIAWAVRVVSARIPHATCLTQALATQILLARAGWPSRLTHGVARDANGTFCAHAWVEVAGRVVIGGEGLERYSRLPDLTTIA